MRRYDNRSVLMHICMYALCHLSACLRTRRLKLKLRLLLTTGRDLLTERAADITIFGLCLRVLLRRAFLRAFSRGCAVAQAASAKYLRREIVFINLFGDYRWKRGTKVYKKEGRSNVGGETRTAHETLLPKMKPRQHAKHRGDYVLSPQVQFRGLEIADGGSNRSYFCHGWRCSATFEGNLMAILTGPGWWYVSYKWSPAGKRKKKPLTDRRLTSKTKKNRRNQMA